MKDWLKRAERQTLLGGKDKITSARVLEVVPGLYQIEVGMGTNGFFVRLDNAETAAFISDVFRQAAASMQRSRFKRPIRKPKKKPKRKEKKK